MTFQSTSYALDGNSIDSYAWQVDGSGFIVGGSKMEHSFLTPGPHTVALRVTDDQGASNTTPQTVVVDTPPTSSFTYGPSSPRAGEAVTFASSSYDPDGTIVAQAWDLTGSGSFDGGSGAMASRVFPAAGTYTVRLRVWDNSGSFDTSIQSIVVAGAEPGQKQPLGVVGPPMIVAGTAAIGTRGGPTGSEGLPGLRWLTPGPVVRLSGVLVHHSTRVNRLTVVAPRGARIELRCSGTQCPRRKRISVVRNARGALPLRFKAFERRFASGSAIEILVSKPGMVGKYTRFRFRSSRAPSRTDACLLPGRSAPAACPAS